MHSVKGYLSRQSTELLFVVLRGLDYKKEFDIFCLITEILHRRIHLMKKYAPSKLEEMSSEMLVEVMNNPEILTEDLVVSRSIIEKSLEILHGRNVETAEKSSPGLQTYLQKYASYCCSAENWET